MYVFLAVLGLSKYSACLGGLGSGSVSFTWRLKDSQHQRPGPTQRGSCWPPPSPHATVTNIPWSAINCHHKTQSQAHEGSHEVKVKWCPVKETRLCLPQHGKGARRTRSSQNTKGASHDTRSLLCGPFSSCSEQGLLSSRGVQASRLLWSTGSRAPGLQELQPWAQ